VIGGKSFTDMHCELMAKEWGIEREAQDRLALQSHWNAEKSYKEGFYADLVAKAFGLEKDVLVRGDSSLEKLKKLRPAFDPVAGTLTAGNSTALTDGSAAVLLASESACKNRNWKPLARLVEYISSARKATHHLADGRAYFGDNQHFNIIGGKFLMYIPDLFRYGEVTHGNIHMNRKPVLVQDVHILVR
jgi:hypothetical protein